MKKGNLLALIELFIMKICKRVVLPCLTSSFKCFNVPLFQCFSPSYFPVLCSRFFLRRVKMRIFTLIEFLMSKSCKSGILFRQQGWTGRCQSPDPASSFFLPLLNCSIVRLFQCFSTSSFPVPCSRFLLRRVKIRIFTLFTLAFWPENDFLMSA